MIIFFTLVLMHVVGDFYLQTNLIATRKSNFDCANKGFVNIKYLTFHTLLYWIPFFLCFFLLQWDWCLLVLPVTLVSHWVIDLFTCWLRKHTKRTFTFLLDQFLHIIILFIFFKTLPFDSTFILSYEKAIYGVIIIFFLIKPSIIIVDLIIYDIFGDTMSNGVMDSKFDVGAIIGVFERIIALVLSIFNAITAVAIIITVKTWARSKDIKDDVDNFGKKYLIGTLASLSLALIAAFLWYKLIGKFNN